MFDVFALGPTGWGDEMLIDAAYLRAGGGNLADWASSRGCVAVEVMKADGTPVMTDSQCFDMPSTDGRDRDGGQGDIETDVSELGGCDTMAGSSPNSGLWITTIALLLGFTRRRR